MKAERRFGDILGSLAARLAGTPEAAELAEEILRLADEIRALAPEHPLVGGVAVALRMTDGARSAAAPLLRLAAEMIADFAVDEAGSAGWSAKDLLGYLEGLGPQGAADFLAALGSRIRSAAG